MFSKPTLPGWLLILLSIVPFQGCARGHQNSPQTAAKAPQQTQPSNSDSQEEDPGEAGLAAAKQILFELETYDHLSTPHHRPDDGLRIIAIMRRIDPWFTVDEGILPAQVSGDYTLYPLKKIPAPVITRLKKRLFDKSFKSGFLILQHDFWEELARRQNSSENTLTYALLSTPEERVGGVFMSDRSMIGIGPFANPGTFVHEYRHYEQHLGNPRDNSLPARQLINDQCLRSFIWGLQEVDATLHQMSLWRGLVARLPMAMDWTNVPESERQIKHRYSQIELLSANLAYSAENMARLTDPDCPLSVREMGLNLAQSFSDSNFSLAGRELGTLVGLRNLHISNWQSVRKECAQEKETPPSPACEEARGDLADTTARINQQKIKIESELSNQGTLRKNALEAALDGLDPAIHDELCSWAGVMRLASPLCRSKRER